MKTIFIKTDKHVFGAIYREHQKDLQVYSSFSNPYPSELSMTPQMETTWQLKGSNEAPLMRHRVEWEENKRDTTEHHEYWLAVNIYEDQS